MLTEYDIFLKTLQIGERLLCVSYTDYQDAFSFSNDYYSESSHHLIDFFENHSDKEKGEYEFDLIRYFYIKAIEHRISSDIFAETSRGNVCDILRSPLDIVLQKYPTNLPHHLEEIVNSNMPDARRLAQRIIEEVNRDNGYCLCESVLNAVMFLGQTVGYHIGQENLTYKGYSCSEMLTRNEINNCAGYNLCKWLEGNGYEIEETNFSRESCQNIVATKDNNLYFILLAAEVAPINPGFFPIDVDSLYYAAEGDGALPYYASISLGSANEKHFKDGVILYGDKIRFMVNAFEKLELEIE